MSDVLIVDPGGPGGPDGPSGSGPSEDDERRLLEITISPSRRIRNRLATLWMAGSFVVVIIPLGFIVGYVIAKGLSVMSVDWFTKPLAIISSQPGGGMAPAIVGTIVITFWATAMAVPLGVLGAIYLHEYGGKGSLARVIRFMSDVMTGVPSIVMGLFIYTIWTLRFGLSGFAGSLALACLMLPIVIRSTEEMLRLVPDDLRMASYALGNRKWRTVLTVVLPAAVGGIVSGVMLAVARAAGETAPLLCLIGASRAVNWNAFSGVNSALSMQIFSNASTPFAVAQDRAWGAALTLVALILILNIVARFFSRRSRVA